MKMEMLRHGIRIIPEGGFTRGDERDVAYIEEVLGLKKDGDAILLVRRNAARLSCLGYLETRKPDETQCFDVDEYYREDEDDSAESI